MMGKSKRSKEFRLPFFFETGNYEMKNFHLKLFSQYKTITTIFINVFKCY